MDRAFMEAVYQSLQGELIEPVDGVENTFAEGSACDQRYEEMLAAYQRLKERLNAGEEDPDVEIIINAKLPSAPTTRWHGTIMEIGLRPTAPPTACADIFSISFCLAICFAISP